MSSPSTPSNPERFDDRSLGGILVHPLAMVTAFIGPAVVYAVSDHEFTRENARHAFNWHATVVTLAVVAFVTGFLSADEVTVGGESIDPLSIPAPIDTVLMFVGVLLLLATMVAVVATFAYAIIATVKAVSGTAWSYPGAVDIVERFL
ncbi:DUF4870 domain-containing protein [Natronorubrum daqingense]|uniref:Acyltransferase n=1 Tax=Natronorubrum daqingense TaxID=588898 RepID=A0A1N7FFZ0_9EURY|nr:DUF4870 domain-containing protein [Natronorubrum daqingense]APX98419.1 acyltransferase [Natronorubrum daqingense]SIR99338.1 hypothetical protein SAMN05421809_3198 [Natronorubrum daqingense]